MKDMIINFSSDYQFWSLKFISSRFLVGCISNQKQKITPYVEQYTKP